RVNLRLWAQLQDNRVLANRWLEEGYNWGMNGSLTFQVMMDTRTGHARSEIMASSLANAIEVQWGMSVAANVMHRQWTECSTWFAVHPGAGRPEKQFCSDACRMRAYRQRKAGMRSGSTNRSRQTSP